jgi:outer membrane protein TolC
MPTLKSCSRVLTLFCIFATQIAFADTKKTLSGLVAEAMAHSPVLQKADAENKQASWKKSEGFSSFLPTVSLSANHFFEKKYQYLDVTLGASAIEIPQIFPSTSGTLSARWVIFDGLANLNLYRSSMKASDAAKARFDWVRFQLERDVTLSYYKVVSSIKLEAVAKENLKTLQNHLEQINNLKKGGLATTYDVLRVESQLSEAQAELLQSTDNIDIAYDRLKLAVGLEEPILLSDEALPLPNPSQIKTLIFNPDSHTRLDLVALEKQADAAESVDQASSYFWVPKIGLGADYIKYNNLTDGASDWSKYRNAWNVGVFLNWTLFDAKQFSQAKQNQYQSLAAEKGVRQALLQSPADFEFWKKRYLYSASLFEAKNADLRRAEETVRLADAGFKAGIRTTTEVLDAELELFRARAGIVNTLINCLEAKIKLELTLGEPL